MIGYNPKDAVLVWPAGEYQATLVGVEEKQSRAGNDMYVLTLKIYREDRSIHVEDYVVLPTFTWKLKRLAQAFGVEDEFKAGKFDPADYSNRNLTVTLSIQEAQGEYEERNKVIAYAPKKTDAKPHAQAPEDDDLPF